MRPSTQASSSRPALASGRAISRALALLAHGSPLPPGPGILNRKGSEGYSQGLQNTSRVEHDILNAGRVQHDILDVGWYMTY